MARTICWDVDTQVDFLSPSGKLYVPGAEEIVANLAKLTQWAKASGTLVISTACAHRPEDPEFAQWGEHCVLGTEGQKKVPETLLPRRMTIPSRKSKVPTALGAFQQVIIEKQHFDVFRNPNTITLLDILDDELEVVLYGVVAEVCVACAGRGLMDYGARVHLVKDAIAHIDEKQADEFVAYVRDNGGVVIDTKSVLRG